MGACGCGVGVAELRRLACVCWLMCGVCILDEGVCVWVLVFVVVEREEAACAA